MSDRGPHPDRSSPLSPTGLHALFGAAMTGADESTVADHPALAAARNEGFDPLERIGAGGVAEVWRAVDQNTGRDVVLKVARRDAGGEDVEGEQAAWSVLKQEGEVLGQVNVPGVIPLLRRGGVGPSRFLVFPLIEGWPLDVYAAKQQDAGLLTDVLQQLVRLVADLHDAGFAHGDLKPGNVLVTARGEVTLIDLGFALRLNEAVAPSLRLELRGGTPAFLPSGDLGEWSARGLDQFGLGRTLISVTETPAHAELHRRVAQVVKPWLAGDAALPSAQLRSAALRLWEPLPPERTRRRKAIWIGAPAILIGVVAAGFLLTRGDPGPAPPDAAPLPVRGAEVAAPDPWSAALTALRKNDHGAAAQVLARVPPDERGWAWRYLHTRSTGRDTTQRWPWRLRGVGAVTPRVWGRWAEGDAAGRVAVSGRDGTGWDRTVSGTPIEQVVWSRSGAVLLAIDAEGMCVLFDAGSGDALLRRRFAGLRPTGARLVGYPMVHVVHAERELRALDLASGVSTTLEERGPVWLAPGSPSAWLVQAAGDGQTHAVLTDTSGIVRWRLPLGPGETPAAFDLHEPTGRIGVALTDGRFLLAGMYAPQVRRIDLPSSGAASVVAFAPDGKSVLVAGDGVWVVDIRSPSAPAVPVADALSGRVRAAGWVPEADGVSIQSAAGMMLVGLADAPPADEEK